VSGVLIKLTYLLVVQRTNLYSTTVKKFKGTLGSCGLDAEGVAYEDFTLDMAPVVADCGFRVDAPAKTRQLIERIEERAGSRTEATGALHGEWDVCIRGDVGGGEGGTVVVALALLGELGGDVGSISAVGTQGVLARRCHDGDVDEFETRARLQFDVCSTVGAGINDGGDRDVAGAEEPAEEINQRGLDGGVAIGAESLACGAREAMESGIQWALIVVEGMCAIASAAHKDVARDLPRQQQAQGGGVAEAIRGEMLQALRGACQQAAGAVEARGSPPSLTRWVLVEELHEPFLLLHQQVLDEALLRGHLHPDPSGGPRPREVRGTVSGVGGVGDRVE
jgi:hypothetical protein